MRPESPARFRTRSKRVRVRSGKKDLITQADALRFLGRTHIDGYVLRIPKKSVHLMNTGYVTARSPVISQDKIEC